jgi:hypothetical protein
MNLLFGRNKSEKKRNQPPTPAPAEPEPVAQVAEPPPIPEVETRQVVVLDFADFRPKIVPSLLRPLKAGESTRIEFEIADIVSRVAGGRLSVRISDIFGVRPELFSRGPQGSEDVELLFPWSKVWPQIEGAGASDEMRAAFAAAEPGPPPEAERPDNRPDGPTEEEMRRLEQFLSSVAGSVRAENRVEEKNGGSKVPPPAVSESGSADERYENLRAQFQRVSQERGMFFSKLNELRGGIEAERAEMRRLMAAAEERCRQANERTESYAKAVELRDRELAAAREEIVRLKDRVAQLQEDLSLYGF